MRRRGEAAAIALALLLAGVARAATVLSPEETVRRYLSDVKQGNFEDAYDLVSSAMRRGKDRETWAREQKAAMALADVKIFSTEVYPAKLEGDKAYVPDILSSQDRFLNQLGLTEYEVYTLVKEDGVWKIDQQMDVEPPEVPKWFPKGARPSQIPPSS